ncbi:MAG: hypothetical protein KIY10_09210 [Thermoplasmata archaeon]|nr:hypothetical protein [Candidatus Sysuiplasma jiujiangense]
MCRIGFISLLQSNSRSIRWYVVPRDGQTVIRDSWIDGNKHRQFALSSIALSGNTIIFGMGQ